MILGVDYDGTWAVKPEFWEAVTLLAGQHGIQVVIVTNRDERTPVTGPSVPVVYARGEPKRRAAARSGYDVNIWVDDFPHLVDLGHSHPVAKALGLP